MTSKKTKQVHKKPEEVADDIQELREQDIDKECAIELEEVLQKHKRALQTYLVRSEFATVPRVRLVRVPQEAEQNGEKAAG